MQRPGQMTTGLSKMTHTNVVQQPKMIENCGDDNVWEVLITSAEDKIICHNRVLNYCCCQVTSLFKKYSLYVQDVTLDSDAAVMTLNCKIPACHLKNPIMGQCCDAVSRALVSINRNLNAYVILDKVFPTFLENFGGARFWKDMLNNYVHAATINTAVIAKTWSHHTLDSRELKAAQTRAEQNRQNLTP